ncbi:hypothetical protein ACFE04_021450 [Oxalis oulophora]
MEQQTPGENVIQNNGSNGDEWSLVGKGKYSIRDKGMTSSLKSRQGIAEFKDGMRIVGDKAIKGLQFGPSGPSLRAPQTQIGIVEGGRPKHTKSIEIANLKLFALFIELTWKTNYTLPVREENGKDQTKGM